MSTPLLDRIPPQNLEAEQATLGAMLIEKDAIARAADVLRAEDFYSLQHQLLFRALVDLFGDGSPADLVTVQARLRDRGDLEGVGGLSYLMALQESAPTAAAVTHYARIVREKATLRNLIAAGGKIRDLAAGAGDEDVETVMARCSELVADLSAGAAGALETCELRDFLGKELQTSAFVVEGLLRAGTVSFLYGPPSSGKSILAADLCRCAVSGRSFLSRFACARGAAVLIEQESAPSLLQQRLADLEAGESLPPDCEPLTILPLQGLRLDDPRSRAALRALLRGLRPVVIVIDTLAAVAGATDLLKVEHVRPLMAYLRQIAADLAAAVVVLAHSPKWHGKAPTLEALYGSVDLGAAVDAAFALCRLPVAGHTFRLTQTKNRWGADLVDVTCAFGAGPDGGMAVTSPEGAGVEQVLLEALEGGDWTATREVMEQVKAAGYTDRAGRKVLRRLDMEGAIETRGETTSREYRRREEA